MSWNRTFVRGFELLFRPWMRRRIASINIRGFLGDIPTDRPVIVVPNHTSWWDAFLVRDLQLRTGSKHPFYTLMNEDELARYSYFRRMGVLGISSSSAAVLKAIRELQRCDDPYWLLMFAQGKIWPSWKRPLGFRPGVELFSGRLAPCTVLPLALHLEPMTKASPTAFIGIAKPIAISEGEAAAANAVEEAVTELLDELHHTLAEHGESAAAVWRTGREVRA